MHIGLSSGHLQAMSVIFTHAYSLCIEMLAEKTRTRSHMIIGSGNDKQELPVICKQWSCFQITLEAKQLLGNVFKTFQNGWTLVEMLS